MGSCGVMDVFMWGEYKPCRNQKTLLLFFPHSNINSLPVWGDGGQAGALEGGSRPHTTAHSCPPGPAKTQGSLYRMCLHTRTHTHTAIPPPPVASPPPHTFPSITCPFQPPLLSAQGTPRLRSPYPHGARSHTAHALADSPPLTTAERYIARCYFGFNRLNVAAA